MIREPTRRRGPARAGACFDAVFGHDRGDWWDIDALSAGHAGQRSVGEPSPAPLAALRDMIDGHVGCVGH